MDTAKPSRRLKRVLAPLIVIGGLGFVGWALVTAFNLGASSATAGAAGALLVYQVPAMAFDWPRLTLEDVGDFFAGVVEWIMSLFGW